MAYEIPQQLEYHEKIMFNLTLKQLGYLFLFAPQVLIIFLKTNLPFYAKTLFSLLPSSLGIGFMFLNLDKHIADWYSWWKFRKVEKPEKINRFIGVKEIKHNLIFTNDNKKVAILKVSPINFSIKPQATQETIILMFQKFLNALDFPVQIIMSTESLNLQDYLKTMEKKIESRFAELFKEYQSHLEQTVAKHHVMNRSFYLVIPEKTNIDIQLQICEKKLNAIGLKTNRLIDMELWEIVHNFFSKPKRIENNTYHLTIDNTWHKIISAHGYPRNVEIGFLDKIVSSLGNFDLSLHIEPYSIETMMVKLNKELQKQNADLYTAKSKGIYNPSLEIKYADTKSILENLQKGREKLFDVSLYVNCRAKSKEELHTLSKRIESELNSLMIIPKSPHFRMAQGFISCAPLANNRLGMRRNITTEALSAFFPFTSSFLQVDKTGVWLGLNKNNIPIVKDIFKLSNPNGLCLASSGSGKSYMAKLLISRYLLHGTKVMVIDPQGEYKGLVKRFNGQLVDLSRSSDTIINPLDLMGHDYPEKRLALMDLMQIMLGDMSEPQKAILDKAITDAYRQNGISDNPDTWDNKPPILEDILDVLKGMEKKASAIEESTIQSLINRMNIYVNGVFSFLNQHTSINFRNQFVCFDIGNLPKQIKPVMMFLVLDYIYMKMKKDLNRKLLVIDEAWSLLGRTADASYVFEIVKTCRKFNLALFLINQEVEGMLASEAGKSVLANSSYTLLLRQKPAVMRQVQNTFYLSETEKNMLLTAEVGEGVLLMEDEHSEIRIVASNEEHKLITTKPDELLEQKKEPDIKIKHKKINSKSKKPLPLDPYKGFYKKNELSEYDINSLIKRGYKEFSFSGLLSNKKESYLIKPRKGESPQHFLMIYDIVEYLKKFTNKIWMFETQKPDIVFEINKKRYAIEVETGKVYNRDKKRLRDKVNRLNEEFGDNWFFVVTDRNYGSRYNEFGKTYDKRMLSKKIIDLTKNG